MDRRYRKRRREIEKFFTDANRLKDETETIVSPSGNYELTIERYRTREGAWDYSRGTMRRVFDRSVVADVKRNYSHFWHAWHVHHNSQEYILCGEDYQGYTVVNLTKGQPHIHFPEAGYRGVGFCWIAAYPSPDSAILAVAGCYWACPYEIVFFDFSTPDTVPYRELTRIASLDGEEGWIDNETFVLRIEEEVRKTDRRPYGALSEEEQSELDNDPYLVDYVVKTVECKPRELTKQGIDRAPP